MILERKITLLSMNKKLGLLFIYIYIYIYMRIPSIRMGCKAIILRQLIINRQVIKNHKIQINMNIPNHLKQINLTCFIL
jgi:hypothetical protein